MLGIFAAFLSEDEMFFMQDYGGQILEKYGVWIEEANFGVAYGTM